MFVLDSDHHHRDSAAQTLSGLCQDRQASPAFAIVRVSFSVDTGTLSSEAGLTRSQLIEYSAPPTVMSVPPPCRVSYLRSRLIIRSLAVLIVFALLPKSTTQLVLLFGSKVEISCVLLSLLTRVSNAGVFADGGTMMSLSAEKQSVSRSQYSGIHSVL